MEKEKRKTVAAVAHLISQNFGRADAWATLTYPKGKIPTNQEEAEAHINDFIRRLEKWMERAKVKGTLKYMCMTRYGEGEAYHHIITNFPNKDALEDLWNRGRSYARPLIPDAEGYETLVRLILSGRSEKNHHKKCGGSRRGNGLTKQIYGKKGSK